MIEGPGSGQVLHLSRAAGAAARRLRFNAALRRFSRLLPLPLGYALLGLLFAKWALPEHTLRVALGYAFIVLASVPVGAGIWAFWSARASRGALALDQHHRSADRITAALEFSALAPAARTPFMEAAIADAVRRVPNPSAKAAVPVRFPRALWASLGLALLVLGASRLPARTPRALARVPAPSPLEPVVLAEDDLGLLRDSMQELTGVHGDPELSEAVARFNRVVEELARHEMDRTQLFQKLADIERALGNGSEEEDALDAGLRDLATALAKSPLSRPVAEALKQRRLPDAERALRELANRLGRREKVDRPALEQLRKALEAATAQASGRVLRLDESRRKLEEEQKRLLQKKASNADAGPIPEQDEHGRERRLEHLDRERTDASRAQQALSQLDRDLAKAAQELMNELGKSAENLQSGARDLQRMAQQQLTDQQKQALKQRLEELKELLRQGGPGREQHQRRLREFAARARGKDGEQKPGEQNGQGQANGAQTPELVFGPGGTPLPLPGSGQTASNAGRSGQSSATGQGQSGSREWGSGSDQNVRGAATKLQGKTEDVSAAAIDTGQGAASSEVVFGASERGFTGSHYQKVYAQYRTVAEDVLHEESIPAGYEFYVRRYFQLIRPRGEP
jgi:hypothetical protein